MGLIWGPKWDPFGDPFLFGAHLGPIWGPILRDDHFIWGPFGTHFVWGPFGACLGPILPSLGPILGPILIWGPFWGPFGGRPSLLSPVGGPIGRVLIANLPYLVASRSMHTQLMVQQQT